MRFKLSVVVFVLLMPVTCFAQAAASAAPCERNPAPHAIGGIDEDVLRCQLAFQAEQITELSAELAKFKALYVLSSKDVAAQAKATATRQQDLDIWFRGYFGK